MLKTLVIVLIFFSISWVQAQNTDACLAVPINDFLVNGNLSNSKQCKNVSKPPNLAERVYFNLALAHRSDDLMCAENGIYALAEHKTPVLEKQFEKLLKLTEKKAQLIAELKKHLINLVAERGRLTPTMHKEKIIENDRLQSELNRTIELTYQSMYLGSTTQMRKFADSLVKMDKTAERKKELFYNTLLNVAIEAQQQRQALIKSDLSTEPSNELKRSLIKDPEILQKIISSKNVLDATYYKNLHCQLDDKFGYRKEAREQKIDLALNAAAILIPIGTGFTLLKFAGSRAIATANLARNTKIMSYSMSGLAGAYSASSSVSRACSASSRDYKISSKASCLGSKNELQDYMISNLEKQDCDFELMLQGLYLAPGAALEVQQYLKSRAELKTFSKNLGDITNANYYTADEHANLTSFGKYISNPLDKLQKSQDAHALYLKEVGILPNSNLIPNKIFSNVDDKISELVKSGAYSEKDVLRPGRVYKNAQGEIKVYGLTDIVPKDTKPFDGLLSEKDYWKTLASGKFPIGEISDGVAFSGNGIGPAFFHDLSHFSGLSRDPEYMATLRRTAEKVSKMPLNEIKAMAPRLNFASEQMVAFPKNSESLIEKVLSTVKPVGKKEPLNQSQYFSILQDKTDEELKKIWERSEKEIPKLKSVGGLSSDTVTKKDRLAIVSMSPIENAYLGNTAGAYMENNGFARDAMIEALSSRLTVADHLKGKSPSQITSDLVANRKESSVIKLFCSNPQMWNYGSYAGIICE
ncbi:MAG: hypothetical protein H7328_06795 [Bdellovibrio sp.]|nr:hypothetical protein [Bdellovibrio sp.]